MITAGLSPAEAERKARMFAENDRALDAWRPHDEAERLRWFVPGRIEVLGKHTDYAGGRSLLCAVERGFCVTAIPRHDDVMRVVDVGNQVDATFRVSEDQQAETRWRTYPATVARRVARNFPFAPSSSNGLRGADIAFASDLPRAAGVSSSTALIIAIFTVLAEINQLEQHPAYRENIPTIDALASYLGCVENGRTFGTLTGDTGVGTRGGAQDHTAMLRSVPGHLVRYAYSPPTTEAVIPLPTGPQGLTFVIGASGVAAEKTGAAKDQYNRAAAAVAAILDVWRDATGRDAPTLFDLVTTVERTHLRRLISESRHPRFTADALLARLDHFVHEALDTIPNASDALARGDLDAFGALVDDSQSSAERWLANQIPETMALARLARARGAIAASAFGAGFGGSVWALVRTPDASTFIETWRADYLGRFPAHADLAQFFVTAPGPPRIRV